MAFVKRCFVFNQHVSLLYWNPVARFTTTNGSKIEGARHERVGVGQADPLSERLKTFGDSIIW